MFLTNLFNFKKTCNHEKINPDLDFGYCPDCGKLVKNEWYVTRCSCCGVKMRAIIKGEEILPQNNFCINCGCHDFYIEKFYLNKNGKIMGIKDIKDDDIFHPAFIMAFDMNGLKGPNTWGKDIFGVNIFADGKTSPIGAGWDIEDLKKDCSEVGTGVSCSYYYRIGGEFNE